MTDSIRIKIDEDKAKQAIKNLEQILTEGAPVTRAEFDHIVSGVDGLAHLRNQIALLEKRMVAISNDLNERLEWLAAQLDTTQERVTDCEEELDITFDVDAPPTITIPRPASLTGQELSDTLKRHVYAATQSGVEVNYTEAALDINKRMGVK